MAPSSQVPVDPSTSELSVLRDEPLRLGWSQVPHQLWSAPISSSAIRVIGWLWSHDERYLSKLSMNRAAGEVGMDGETLRRAVAELAEGGALRLTGGAQGKRYRITLATKWWRDLFRLPHIEEQLPQNEEQLPQKPVTEKIREHQLEVLPGFDEFWSLYPRKEGKKNAQREWGRMTPASRVLALARVRLPNNGIKNVRGKDNFTPHPTTWLHGERWLDELPGEAHTPAAPHWKDQLQAEEAARKANLERLAERKRAEDERLAQLEAEQDAR